MRIYKKEKSWIDKNIKKKFAIIPVRCDFEELMWLEWYYYYDDTRCCWIAPCKDYKDKEDFYKELKK